MVYIINLFIINKIFVRLTFGVAIAVVIILLFLKSSTEKMKTEIESKPGISMSISLDKNIAQTFITKTVNILFLIQPKK